MLCLEICVALVPSIESSKDIQKKSFEVAQAFSGEHYKVLVQIEESNMNQRLSIAPHLTLYQLSVPMENINEVTKRLDVIAQRNTTVEVAPTGYFFNEVEGSVEIRYAPTAPLMCMQECVVNCLNDLRRGLLIERDPAGNSSDLSDANVLAYGWQDGINNFNPHTTLNWISQISGQLIDNGHCILPKLVLPTSSTFDHLALFAMGPHGTCCQRIHFSKLH